MSLPRILFVSCGGGDLLESGVVVNPLDIENNMGNFCRTEVALKIHEIHNYLSKGGKYLKIVTHLRR